METYEDIQAVLEIDGDVLSFSFGDIYAAKSTDTALLHQEPSLSVVEQQEFMFYVSTQDCLTNNIVEDNEFTITDDLYVYSFVVTRNPIPFIDGWSRLPAMQIGKTEI